MSVSSHSANPFPPGPGQCHLLSIPTDLSTVDISHKLDHTVSTWPFVLDCFYFESCFQGSSTSWHVSVLHSFFEADQHGIVWIDSVWFIHSFVNGHLGCFRSGTIMNYAAENIHVQVFCVDTCF